MNSVTLRDNIYLKKKKKAKGGDDRRIDDYKSIQCEEKRTKIKKISRVLVTSEKSEVEGEKILKKNINSGAHGLISKVLHNR